MWHLQQGQGLAGNSKVQQQQQQWEEEEEGLLPLGTALARHPRLLAQGQTPACLLSLAPHPPAPAGASVCWALLLRLLLTPWGWQGLTWAPWLAV